MEFIAALKTALMAGIERAVKTQAVQADSRSAMAVAVKHRLHEVGNAVMAQGLGSAGRAISSGRAGLCVRAAG